MKRCEQCRVAPMAGYYLSLPGTYAPELSRVPKAKVTRVRNGRTESFVLQSVCMCRSCFELVKPIDQRRHEALLSARSNIER